MPLFRPPSYAGHEMSRGGVGRDGGAGSFLTHYECSECGRRHEALEPQTLCRCGKPLFARYDLAAARRRLSPEEFGGGGLWSFQSLLPVTDPRNVVSLGEGATPLVDACWYAAGMGLRRLWVKDEGRLPTGSFKARGLSVAVSLAKEHGFATLAVPSAGNAAAALSAYRSPGRHGSDHHALRRSTRQQARVPGLRGRLFLEMGLSPTPQRSSPSARPASAGAMSSRPSKEPGRLEGEEDPWVRNRRADGVACARRDRLPYRGRTGLIGILEGPWMSSKRWAGSARKRPRNDRGSNRRDARPSSAPL